MNSYFDELFGRKTSNEKHRTFSQTEIPGLVDRLIAGIEGEEPVAQLLEEALKDESKATVTMKISKKDFGEMLLAFENLTNHSKKMAEIKMTLDSLIGLYNKAHETFKSANNESNGLQEVKKMFGWRHKKPVAKERIFWEYIELIMGTTTLLKIKNPQPMSKIDAINYLKKKYDFVSYDSAYKQVQRGLEEWKHVFGDKEYMKLLPENALESKK